MELELTKTFTLNFINGVEFKLTISFSLIIALYYFIKKIIFNKKKNKVKCYLTIIFEENKILKEHDNKYYLLTENRFENIKYELNIDEKTLDKIIKSLYHEKFLNIDTKINGGPIIEKYY